MLDGGGAMCLVPWDLSSHVHHPAVHSRSCQVTIGWSEFNINMNNHNNRLGSHLAMEELRP